MIAYHYLLEKNNLLTENVNVVIYPNLRSFTHENIDQLDKVTETFIRISKSIDDICIDQGLFCIGSKYPPSTKLLENIKRKMVDRVDNKKEIKEVCDRVQNNYWIKKKNLFYDNQMKPIVDEMEFLRSIQRQLQ
jgi:hypothetical protein